MTTTLATYIGRQAAADEAIAKLSSLLDTPTVRELIVAVKTLELLAHYEKAAG